MDENLIINQLNLIKQEINKLEGMLDHTKHISEIENDYISKGNTKILIVIPTEQKLENDPDNLKDLIIPTGCQVKYLNVHSLPVAEAYCVASKVCIEDQSDFMLTVEDDTYPPSDGLVKLLSTLRDQKDISAIGGWYPKKNCINEGVHIVLSPDKKYRTELKRSHSGISEVYTLAMGFSLYRGEMFKYISNPKFVTTDTLTQDSFFSQKARNMGYKLYCDLSVKCKHIDRESGKIYE